VAYGIEGVTVNGNDPEAMYSAAAKAIAGARAGNGPTLLEAKTFRFMGHFFGDDGSYIEEQIMADRMAKDPVPALRERLLSEGHADESALSAIEGEANANIDDALEFARNSEYPDVAELGRDVYAEEVLV
jgi:pyruvate dehydrogenase E1 component alpha subunit